MPIKQSKNQVRKLKKMSFQLTVESLQWWRWDYGLWQTVPDLSCGNWKGTTANSRWLQRFRIMQRTMNSVVKILKLIYLTALVYCEDVFWADLWSSIIIGYMYVTPVGRVKKLIFICTSLQPPNVWTASVLYIRALVLPSPYGPN